MIYSRYENDYGNFIKKLYKKIVPIKLQTMRSLYIEKKMYSQELKHVIELYRGGVFEFPQTIEIETINRCNGTCSFCPINKNHDTRPYAKMDENLFHKIMDELKVQDYAGSLQLFSNNEPFLDTRIIEWAGIARKELPKAYMILYTNGTLLTIDKINQIMPFLDKLIIDNYNDNLSLIPSVKQVYDYCEANHVWTEKIEIHLRKQNEVLTTRGGEAPNKLHATDKKISKLPCIYPFMQMVIRPDGKVSLCCNDAFGKNTLGDITVNSIKEVWEGRMYRDIREQLSKGRDQLKMCKNCDTIHLLFKPGESL